MADTPASEPVATYETRVSGLWSTRHTISSAGEELGVLSVEQSALGMIRSGHYKPEKGEELHFRRDPGLLRSQFSMWTDGQEWLGSSLRWSYFRREINVHNGGRPYRVLPLPGMRRGFSLYAPKTGENARCQMPALGRSSKIEVYRRLDFALLVFCYFLGSASLWESIWPGPSSEEASRITEQGAI